MSIEFVLRLARQTIAQSIFLLLTFRSDEMNPPLRHFLAELDRERIGTELTLARLSERQIAANIPEGSLRDTFLAGAHAQIPAARAPTPRQIAKKEFGGLTPREREIAAMIAQGKTNREIAETLVVSERTVETHVTNVLTKLGFESRTRIAAWAVEKKLGG